MRARRRGHSRRSPGLIGQREYLGTFLAQQRYLFQRLDLDSLQLSLSHDGTSQTIGRVACQDQKKVTKVWSPEEFNRSNGQTTIWAEKTIPVYDLVFQFDGPFIFAVEVAKGSEDGRGGFQPDEPLDAIVGFGWSGAPGKSGGTGITGIGGTLGGAGVVGKGGEGGTGVFGDAGGDATGVIGLGGPHEGTGVFGLGSGGDRVLRRGSGGAGVHGVGGHALLQAGPGDVLPGVGVFGQGGKILEENRDRLLLGTGVIGVGGDANNKDMPATNEAGSVGVFGQGADAKINTIVDGGTTVTDGPAEPGAGVIGRGGIVTGARIPPAAGVIGLAGGLTKPDISMTGNAGVVGVGRTGVRGIGVADGAGALAGPGVSGFSDTDRGGVFASRDVAQAQLVPKRVATTFPQGSPITPTGISAAKLEERVVSLPRTGQGGDLMTLIDDSRFCTLWFCVKGEERPEPAQWAQVILGPAFAGQS